MIINNIRSSKPFKYIKNNFKVLISIVLILFLMFFIILSIKYIDNQKTLYLKEVKLTKELQLELHAVEETTNNLEKQVELYLQQLDDSNQQITELKQLIENKTNQINLLEAKNKSLTETLNDLTAVKEGTFKSDGTYDQATKVWNSLKSLDLNDFVCAGIMGNIMAEVGGQTLDISKWPKYSQGKYYGICQWRGSRRQRLLSDFGTTLEDQIEFLSTELFEVIPKDSSFYSMQNEQEAALYFAKHYERCNSKYYSVRLTNATKAFEYFTNI